MASNKEDQWEEVPLEPQASSGQWEEVDVNAPPPAPEPENDGAYDSGSVLGNIAAGIMKGPGIGEYIPVVGPAMANAGRGVSAAIQSTFRPESISEIYEQDRQKDERDRAQYEKEYPAAANVKSFLSSAALPFGKAAEALVPAAQGMKGILTAAGRGAVNVAEGAGVAAADQGLRGNIESILPAAKESAKYGAGFQAALLGAKGLGMGYARYMAGLRPETIQRYVDRHPQINAINEEPFLDEAVQSIDLLKNKAKLNRETLNRNVSNAQMKNKDMKADQLLQSRDEIKMGRQGVDQDYNGRLLNEKAMTEELRNKALTESMNRKTSALEQADRLEREGADSIGEMMQKSGKKIGEASRNALGALDAHKEKIPLDWYKGQLTKGIKANKIGDALLPNDGVNALVKYRALLDETGVKEISAKDLKKLIQSLDGDLEEAYSKAQNGNYNTPAVKSLMAMRRLASARLKRDVPGYKEAMKPVASMVGKVKGLQRDLPNSEGDKIFSKVKGIDGPGKQDLKRKIAAAEAEFGGSGLKKLDEASRLRKLDPDAGQTFEVPNQQFLDYLKNQKGQGLSALEKKAAAAKAKAEQDFRFRGEKISKYEKEKSGRIQQLEKKVDGLGADGAQSKIRRMGGNPEANILMRRKMDEIGRLTGKGDQYFTQGADDLAVKRAMEGSFTRGSRNVNFAEKSFKGLAQALNLNSSGEGAAGTIGATVGLITDVVGPKAVKAVIDMGMTGTGKAARAALSRSLLAGPQAFANTHARLMRDDPEYRKAIEAAESE